MKRGFAVVEGCAEPPCTGVNLAFYYPLRISPESALRALPIAFNL
jgi:hypothetical protein